MFTTGNPTGVVPTSTRRLAQLSPHGERHALLDRGRRCRGAVRLAQQQASVGGGLERIREVQRPARDPRGRDAEERAAGRRPPVAISERQLLRVELRLAGRPRTAQRVQRAAEPGKLLLAQLGEPSHAPVLVARHERQCALLELHCAIDVALALRDAARRFQPVRVEPREALRELRVVTRGLSKLGDDAVRARGIARLHELLGLARLPRKLDAARELGHAFAALRGGSGLEECERLCIALDTREIERIRVAHVRVGRPALLQVVEERIAAFRVALRCVDPCKVMHDPGIVGIERARLLQHRSRFVLASLFAQSARRIAHVSRAGGPFRRPRCVRARL
jgi:hypothetical protein